MDGTQLKKRVMKVKQIDPAAKSSKHHAGEKRQSPAGLTGLLAGVDCSSLLTEPANRQAEAEELSRSIRLTGLVSRTQEGLLQQALEKIAKVKRVEVFADLAEAVVEFASAGVSPHERSASFHKLKQR
jgi:hypothetical protein